MGTTGNDAINGLAGNDIISGLAGNDRLNGGDGIIPSNTQGQIHRLYLGALGRAPDASGFNFWVSQVQSGQWTIPNVIAFFVSSPEFGRRFGQPDNAQFITLLYNNVLGRAPDTNGFNFWMGQLNTGRSRTDLVSAFINSTEFVINTEFLSQAFLAGTIHPDAEGQMFRLYQGAFGRAPDVNGFKFWVDSIQAGAATVASVAAAFVGSGEFQRRFGALDNTAFVNQIYTNVLGQLPDSGTLQGWLNALNAGAPRSDVVISLIESAGNINNTRAAFINFMRSTDLGWQDTLSSGDGTDMLFGGRGADTFVLNAAETGTKTIYGLQAYDFVRLTGFSSLSQVTTALRQEGADTVFTLGTLTVRFVGTTVAAVTSVLQFVAGAEADAGSGDTGLADFADAGGFGLPDAMRIDQGPDQFDFSGLRNAAGDLRLTPARAEMAVTTLSSSAADVFDFAGLDPVDAPAVADISLDPNGPSSREGLLEPFFHVDAALIDLDAVQFDFGTLDRLIEPDWT